jgi:tetratricopeptide (TPR) repeat protein
MSASDVLELQRRVGNQTVSSLLQREAAPAPAATDAADMAYWDDVFVLARRRIAANDFAGAEELLQRVYGDPKFRSADSPGVVLNLGLCRHAQGDFEGAASFYEESLASPSWDEDARRQILDAVRSARLRRPRRGTETEPAKPDAADIAYWDDVFVLARKRIAAKDFAAAEELLQRVYGDPKFRTADSPGVVLNLGLCRHAQGDFAGAISLYRESASSPSWAEDERRQIVDAMHAARLRQPPPNSVAEREQPDAADESYWDDVFALARKKIVEKQFAAAEELLRRVYEDQRFRSADSPGVVLNLGLCRHAQGDYAAAIELYEESLASPKWSEGPRRDILDGIRAARLGRPPKTQA